jgi:hypothetical protein
LSRVVALIVVLAPDLWRLTLVCVCVYCAGAPHLSRHHTSKERSPFSICSIVTINNNKFQTQSNSVCNTMKKLESLDVFLSCFCFQFFITSHKNLVFLFFLICFFDWWFSRLLLLLLFFAVNTQMQKHAHKLSENTKTTQTRNSCSFSYPRSEKCFLSSNIILLMIVISIALLLLSTSTYKSETLLRDLSDYLPFILCNVEKRDIMTKTLWYFQGRRPISEQCRYWIILDHPLCLLIFVLILMIALLSQRKQHTSRHILWAISKCFGFYIFIRSSILSLSLYCFHFLSKKPWSILIVSFSI